MRDEVLALCFRHAEALFHLTAFDQILPPPTQFQLIDYAKVSSTWNFSDGKDEKDFGSKVFKIQTIRRISTLFWLEKAELPIFCSFSFCVWNNSRK